MLERSRTNKLVVYESHESGGSTRFWTSGTARFESGARSSRISDDVRLSPHGILTGEDRLGARASPPDGKANQCCWRADSVLMSARAHRYRREPCCVPLRSSRRAPRYSALRREAARFERPQLMRRRDGQRIQRLSTDTRTRSCARAVRIRASGIPLQPRHGRSAGQYVTAQENA
jgi:hypothetical protein